MSRVCVFQDWIFDLSMQQQSVLVLACRGPDGVGKFHPTKKLVTHYRASVLRAAYLGRPMRVDEGDNTTFMTLKRFSDDEYWALVAKHWFAHVDEIPHHYYMHILHGAEIIGYKHPEELFRTRWAQFYFTACNDLHMNPETEAQLDLRLNDWDQEFWGEAS